MMEFKTKIKTNYFPFQDIENYLRNNSSESRIEKIQEVGRDLIHLDFMKDVIEAEIHQVLNRRDQLQHQVSYSSYFIFFNRF